MQKKNVTIILIAFTLMFALNLVAAQTAIKNIWNPVQDMFTGWTGGNLPVGLAKWLLLALIVMFVYEIVNLVPMIKKMHGFFKFLFSFIVGFLSIAYLVPEEIKVILLSYGVFGLILGGIIPFILLIFFTSDMRKSGEAGGLITSYVTWTGFIGFLIWRVIDVAMKAPEGEKWLWVAYLIIIVVCLIFIFFQKKIMSMLFKAEIDQQVQKMSEGNRIADMAAKAKLQEDLAAAQRQTQVAEAWAKKADPNEVFKE